jgi:serine/threonine protein kinase
MTGPLHFAAGFEAHRHRGASINCFDGMSDTLTSTQKLTRPSAPEQVAVRAKADHDALAPGTHLDEFEIVRVLGAGGFGVVYLAFDHVLRRQVAIKEYMPSMLAGRGEGPALVLRSADLGETFALGLESFFNEARLLACFDHPSLVKVYRCWKAHGTAYMAMQYYPGVTLKQARQGMVAAPDEAWLRAFVEPLLGVLELLHAEGVFHRDIAPDNILLLPDGRPVLLDFGSARRVIGDATQSLTAVLKPNFAPIEQYADMPGMRQGPWTDIYALGATVHFMLTGESPTPAVLRVVRDALPALSGPVAVSFAGVPRGFLEVIDWSLALAPEDRPQSAEIFRQAIDGQVAPPAASSRQRIDPRSFRDDTGFAHTVEPSSVFDAAMPSPDTQADFHPSRHAARSLLSRHRGARLAMGGLALACLAMLGWSLYVQTLDEPAGYAAPIASEPPATTADPDKSAKGAAPRNGAASEVSSSAGKPAGQGSPLTPASAQRSAPAAAAPASPKAACGDLNYFALAVCVSRECQNPRWHSHPQCADTRAMEERRQREANRY